MLFEFSTYNSLNCIFFAEIFRTLFCLPSSPFENQIKDKNVNFPQEDIGRLSEIDNSLAIFCMATYGEGDPTDNAQEMYEWLQSGEVELNGLKFAVSQSKPCHEKNLLFAYAKTKTQISCAVTSAQLISAFVFATETPKTDFLTSRYMPL